MQIIKKMLYNYQFMTDILTAEVKNEENSDMQNIKNLQLSAACAIPAYIPH
jgi:hypothetical protein